MSCDAPRLPTEGGARHRPEYQLHVFRDGDFGPVPAYGPSLVKRRRHQPGNIQHTRTHGVRQHYAKACVDGCRGTRSRKLTLAASLHWAYQNYCLKVAGSCVLAVGLQKPVPENCRYLRPCTGLTKTTARKLPIAVSLHWAHQNHCQKVAASCVLALGLPKLPSRSS